MTCYVVADLSLRDKQQDVTFTQRAVITLRSSPQNNASLNPTALTEGAALIM